jgi:hypothetical protein
MTPPRLSDSISRVLHMQQQQLDRAARPSPVAPGTDREGMPPMTGVGGLAELEQTRCGGSRRGADARRTSPPTTTKPPSRNTAKPKSAAS